MKVPFNSSTIAGNEIAYLQEVVRKGSLSAGGHFGRRCEALLKEYLGGGVEVLLSASCTDALEMCALLLDLGAGDEVIMPSFTFVSTANAFALRGAVPVFVDVDPYTLSLNPLGLEQRITPQTKAIVVVHYGASACDMPAILEIAARHKLPVIEDAAHALGGICQGKPLGTWGALGTFSFHETKNITCGEGGALVVSDPALVERAHILRDKGTNRRNFERGEVPFYSWVDLGSSFGLGELSAAFLCAQLEQLSGITAQRRRLHARYCTELQTLKSTGLIDFYVPATMQDSSAHIFYILMESIEVRDELRRYLRDAGVTAVFHYQPLHQSTYVRERWPSQPHLPVTEAAAGRLLRLPLYDKLSTAEQDLVIESCRLFFKKQ